MNTTDIALLLIDFQEGFREQDYFGGNRNNPRAEANARKILDFFREMKWPVIHTRHDSVSAQSPLRPGQAGNEIMELLRPQPEELVIGKTVNSAFIGTPLQQVLEERGIRRLVVGGLVTNHCVSTTVRMAANYGYEVILLADACAAFDRQGLKGELYEGELVHQVSLASLQDEFARVMDTAHVLDRL